MTTPQQFDSSPKNQAQSGVYNYPDLRTNQNNPDYGFGHNQVALIFKEVSVNYTSLCQSIK